MAQHRRKIILINKGFQLRFCAYICSAFLALCFIYPLIITTLFDYCIRTLVANPNGPEVQSLLQTRHDVMLLVIGTEAAFLAVTFLLGLFISHRIAGPLYKLRRSFEDYARGNWHRPLTFRKGDYFPELADSFNQMVLSLKERSRQEEEMIAIAVSRVETALKSSAPDARAELEPALVTLRKLQDQRSTT